MGARPRGARTEKMLGKGGSTKHENENDRCIATARQYPDKFESERELGPVCWHCSLTISNPFISFHYSFFLALLPVQRHAIRYTSLM